MADEPFKSLFDGIKPETVRPVVATNGKCTDKDLYYSSWIVENGVHVSMYVSCGSCGASKGVMFEADKGSASMYFSVVHDV